MKDFALHRSFHFMIRGLPEVEGVAGFAAEFGDFAAATEVGDEGDGLGGLGFVI
jgi:hypothetical protein